MLHFVPKPLLLLTQTAFAGAAHLYGQAIAVLDACLPTLDPSLDFDADTDWFREEDDIA